MTRVPLAILVVLSLAPASATAQMAGHEREEHASLKQHEGRLAAVQARVRARESGVFPNTGGPPGSPPWIEVRTLDVRNQIAVLLLTGDISPAEATGMAAALGRGNRMIAEELRKVRDRIAALEKRDLAPAGAMAAGPGKESWRFVMVGRDRSEAAAHFTSSGTLEIEIRADGSTYGVARYDSRDAWDDEVRGTVRDGQVRLEYGASNSLRRGVFTGEIAGDGQSAKGTFRIGSMEGTWRATQR